MLDNQHDIHRVISHPMYHRKDIVIIDGGGGNHER